MKVQYIDSGKRKFVAWVGMALLFFAMLGLILVVIFYPRPIVQPKQKTEIRVQTQSIGASALAEDFAVAWIQGEIKTANHYTAKGFEIKEEDITVPKGKVQYRQAVDAYSQGDGKESVTVEVYLKPEKGEMFRVYVSVPVLAKEGGYGVYDYPALISPPARPSVSEDFMSGSSLGQTEEKIIRKRVQSFFRAYTEDRLEDLQFMYINEKQAPKEALPGTFNGINELDIFGKGDKEAVVRALVTLKVGEIEAKQRYQFWVKRQGNEWKVEKTFPRL